MQKKNYYQLKYKKVNQGLDEIKQKLRINSFTRLFFFIAIFLFLFGLINISKVAGIACSVLSLIVFLYLVKKHIRLQKTQSELERYASIYKMELSALKFDWKSFKKGENYNNHSHPFAYDLDLFGQGSLFQYLNRTVTYLGEKYLACLLLNETLDEKAINNRQEAIKELSEGTEILEKFRVAGMLTDDSEEDIVALRKWIESGSYIERNKIVGFLRFVLPTLTILSIILIPFWYDAFKVFTSLFIVNLIITGVYFKKTNAEHQLIGKRLNIIRKYREMLEIITSNIFKSDLLIKSVDKTKANGDNAIIAMKKLSASVSALDNRLNMLAGIFLEGVLVWDFHWLIRINKWKNKHKNDLPLWIEQIGFFDNMITLATFAFNHDNFIFPDISNNINLKTENLGHLLITPDKRVCNDFEISKSDEFIIITGANMAGKSTFLRTVGLNMIMAMCGLPVCATYFSFKPKRLYTSMRTSDSLSDDESYFYAELKRLKDLFDRMLNGEELFIILDEILKGTNSTDKQRGSKAALEKILKLHGTGLIATHDLSLTEIEKEYPDRISNKCFEIEIDNAEIYFDYKLTDGVTKKMNASLLMKQMGILD